MADDFVDIVGSMTNLIQNERISSYNEGLDDAIEAIRSWGLHEGVWLTGREMAPHEGIPELLNEIKEHYEASLQT